MTGDIKTQYTSHSTHFLHHPTAACFFKQVQQKINQKNTSKTVRLHNQPRPGRPRWFLVVLHATTIGFPSIMQCSSEAVDP